MWRGGTCVAGASVTRASRCGGVLAFQSTRRSFGIQNVHMSVRERHGQRLGSRRAWSCCCRQPTRQQSSVSPPVPPFTALASPRSSLPPPSPPGYFWLLHVLSRWEKYTAALGARPDDAAAVGELFPFKEFFSDAPQQIFKGEDREEVGAAGRVGRPWRAHVVCLCVCVYVYVCACVGGPHAWARRLLPRPQCTVDGCSLDSPSRGCV